MAAPAGKQGSLGDSPAVWPPATFDAVRREFRRSRRAPTRDRWSASALRDRLPRVTLDEALEILLTWRGDTGRYDGGAVVWQARLAGYAPRLSLEDSTEALSSLRDLGGPCPEPGAYRLRALCLRHGLDDVAAVLDRWLVERTTFGGL
jgi:hypothetical protein